jgi:ribosomal protein S6--L-glutamate ligase/gamma-F420-2:alpha-L-glutamate ligase
MHGIIVVNAYIKNKSQISQAERVRDELLALGVQVEIVKNFNLASIKNGKINTKECDFCVFFDKDKASARLLEKSGVRLFNRSQAIEICDDKMLTHIALANNNIAMPDCIYAPLCYYPDATPDENFLKEVANSLNFPLVAKTCYGSLGAGVSLIHDKNELYSYEKSNLLTPHFYQRFIDCGSGEDIRVIVIGGKYVCSMKRHNSNDFRSNIELGGTGENYVADKNLIDLCEKVAKIINLDYCGIDVLTDKNGVRYICEVNSNAFFAAAERYCNVNIAKSYATHIITSLK